MANLSDPETTNCVSQAGSFPRAAAKRGYGSYRGQRLSAIAVTLGRDDRVRPRSDLDVVLFHLVFQHHHLLSGYIDPHSYEGLRLNVMYDGLFLVLTFGLTSIGLVMLWGTVNRSQVRLSGVFLSGSIVVGAGVFNVFDGVVSHYVLDLHNVVHNTEAWNPHWIAVSLLMLGAGLGLLYWADGPVHSETRTARTAE